MRSFGLNQRNASSSDIASRILASASTGSRSGLPRSRKGAGSSRLLVQVAHAAVGDDRVQAVLDLRQVDDGRCLTCRRHW